MPGCTVQLLAILHRILIVFFGVAEVGLLVDVGKPLPHCALAAASCAHVCHVFATGLPRFCHVFATCITLSTPLGDQRLRFIAGICHRVVEPQHCGINVSRSVTQTTAEETSVQVLFGFIDFMGFCLKFGRCGGQSRLFDNHQVPKCSLERNRLFFL